MKTTDYRKNRAGEISSPPPHFFRVELIRGGSPLAGKRAGTTKPEAFVAFAALFCAATFPAAAQEIDRELVYDGGEQTWWGTVPRVDYNWSGNIAGLYHFGNKTSTMVGFSEETWRYIFREDHQGTVKILHTVSPGEIVVESGDYVLAPAGWEDGTMSVDGSIKGSGKLIVNAGASLAIYIDNEYSGDTIVEGTLTAAVNEDAGYNTGHGAFGTGTLRVGSTGTVNLNGTVQKNAAAEIAGTLNLGENRSGAAAALPAPTMPTTAAAATWPPEKWPCSSCAASPPYATCSPKMPGPPMKATLRPQVPGKPCSATPPCSP